MKVMKLSNPEHIPLTWRDWRFKLKYALRALKWAVCGNGPGNVSRREWWRAFWVTLRANSFTFYEYVGTIDTDGEK